MLSPPLLLAALSLLGCDLRLGSPLERESAPPTVWTSEEAADLSGARCAVVFWTAEWAIAADSLEREILVPELTRRAGTGLRAARIDVTANSAATKARMAEHGVTVIPTVDVIGEGGSRIDRIEGAADAERLSEALDGCPR